MIKYIICLSLLLSSCDLIPGYTSDNPSEEILEVGIQAATGLPIDLSPCHDGNQEKPFTPLKQ